MKVNYREIYYINFIKDNPYLKNTFFKIKKKLFNLNFEEIYEYCKLLKNNENFCRNISIKQIVTNDKKIIENKSMIFFSDFDIKRLIKSEHLLIDGTFVKPIGFLQTIVIMYFDIIIDKMIPGIFIIINNKTYEGYYDSFLFIKILLIK